METKKLQLLKGPVKKIPHTLLNIFTGFVVIFLLASPVSQNYNLHMHTHEKVLVFFFKG